MKKLKCLDCKETFKAETPEEMMKTMIPHYIEKHKKMMERHNDESKEDWMKRFNKNWEDAKEIKEE